MKNLLSLLISFFILSTAAGQKIQLLYQKTGLSFRGLVAVDAENLWVSGSSGTIGKSTDGGQTWTWVSPKGY